MKNSLLAMVKMEQDFGIYNKDFGNFNAKFIQGMSTF